MRKMIKILQVHLLVNLCWIIFCFWPIHLSIHWSKFWSSWCCIEFPRTSPKHLNRFDVRYHVFRFIKLSHFWGRTIRYLIQEFTNSPILRWRELTAITFYGLSWSKSDFKESYVMTVDPMTSISSARS